MSSPTARMRRLPKLSMSSMSRRISAVLPPRRPSNVGVAAVQANQVLDRRDDVGDGEDRVRQRAGETELLVDLVPADLGEVVALRVEVEVVQQRAGGLGGDLLARTELAVDVAERVFLREDRVLRQRLFDRVEAGELGEDVLAGQAERLEEHGDGLLALAVDAHADLVALVDLELEPRAAARDDARRDDVLVAGLVGRAVEVDAGRADELRDDDTLGAVDDERALAGLEREVAHEDRLGLDLTGLVVHELGLDVERGGVGLAALLALLDRVLLGLEIRVRERELHRLAQVLDRRDLLEDLLEAADLGHVGAADALRLGDARLPARRCRRASRRTRSASASRSGTVSVSEILANERREAPRPFLMVVVDALRAAAKGITSVGPGRGSFPCRQGGVLIRPRNLAPHSASHARRRSGGTQAQPTTI